MGLNIKSERAHKLARQVAAQTGETMTSAIENALQEKLDRLMQNRDVAEKRRRVREILDSLPAPPPGITSDHSDLYDDWGLPK